MDSILYLGMPNATISTRVEGGSRVYSNPLETVLKRMRPPYTYFTIEVPGSLLEHESPGETVLKILKHKTASRYVLITCRREDLIEVARMIFQAELLAPHRCVVITAGDPVVQMDSDGNVNLLMAIGVLRKSARSPDCLGVHIVWQAEVYRLPETPRELR